MSAEVVQFNSISLQDIPGMMRRMADQIEAGEQGDIATAFFVIPRDTGFPTVFGWGDIGGKNDPVIQFELAKMWLLTNMTART